MDKEKSFGVLTNWACRHDIMFDMPVEVQGITLGGKLVSVTDITRLDLDSGFVENNIATFKLVGKGQRMILIDLEEYAKWEDTVYDIEEQLTH
jgi:hypothetical protein